MGRDEGFVFFRIDAEGDNRLLLVLARFAQRSLGLVDKPLGVKRPARARRYADEERRLVVRGKTRERFPMKPLCRFKSIVHLHAGHNDVYPAPLLRIHAAPLLERRRRRFLQHLRRRILRPDCAQERETRLILFRLLKFRRKYLRKIRLAVKIAEGIRLV